MWNWLVRKWQWPAAALFASGFLLAVMPLVLVTVGWPLGLVYAQLPLYMLHQWEEHQGDRFRRYANRVIGGGREALTPAATFWINFLGVWAVDLAAQYAALATSPWAGLTAGYLAVVNALLHIGPALVRREYNPGLVTSVALLLPGGALCLLVAGSGAGMWPHAVGLVAAIGVHVLVVLHVVWRVAHLPRVATGLSAAR